MIYNNRHLLKKNGEGAQKIAERYTYNFNRKKFLELLAGEK